ncbi:MAG: ABC transporter permease [Clostridia bacterium]|nr:ABC transporter permease [Clostridia bacterium]
MNFREKFAIQKNITYELVRKSIKTQYRNSVLGMLWTVLNPLLNMLVMWLVFSRFFGDGDELYPIYLLTGNILFACLRSATEGSLGSIVNNRDLITRIRVESHMFPLSSTIASLVTFGFSMIALLLIMAGMQIFGGYQIFKVEILLVLLMIPAFVLFELGIGLFLSALYVYARDVKYLYSVFLTLWTYATPVFYKVERLSGSTFGNLIKFNPMFHFLNFFRSATYLGFDGMFWKQMLIMYGCALASMLIGTVVFKLLKKNFVMNI